MKRRKITYTIYGLPGEFVWFANHKNFKPYIEHVPTEIDFQNWCDKANIKQVHRMMRRMEAIGATGAVVIRWYPGGFAREFIYKF